MWGCITHSEPMSEVKWDVDLDGLMRLIHDKEEILFLLCSPQAVNLGMIFLTKFLFSALI